MSGIYRCLVRPVLFEQESEAVHDWTLQRLAYVSRNALLCEAVASFFEPPELTARLFGLSFPNPVGLAAGMDKHAVALPAWAALGFGFVELGGVTWHPQPGNPPPRIFRAIPDEALVNRMGFNNPGAGAMATTLREWRVSGRWPDHPVGMNLGKSKITPLDKAAEDYAASLRVLWPHADFFVINVSSPNTPNLRQLQDKSALAEILAATCDVNRELAITAGAVSGRGLARNPNSKIQHAKSKKPILVKVAPDLSFEAIDEILELVETHEIAGIVATNTTTARPPASDPRSERAYAEAGGLSGRPLRARSTEMIRHIFRRSGGALPIIGVGGIFSAEDAWEKIAAGASLVQVYTGLVFEGPALAKEIVLGLHARLAEARLNRIQEAVGFCAA
ncbi:MAG: quinone-dependent dihydroorotate dehydrogenase [Verrucomicrobia bacterium]|nr:quinone-dependent dihydroorotate dehydrogenase [Verrucomicrobiota bacterium]